MELEMDPPQLNNYSKTTGASHAPRETVGESFAQSFYCSFIEKLRKSYFVATNVKGTVKWFHRVRGFGFITRHNKYLQFTILFILLLIKNFF